MAYTDHLTKMLSDITSHCARAAGVEAEYAIKNNGKPCYPSMVGALGAIVGTIAVYVRSASEWTVDHIVPAEREAERLVTILEGLDIELDEESLAALEALIRNQDEYRSEIRALSGAFQKAVRETIINERELEQQNATEALASAGFVLNDEDGETWARESERVLIELTNGRESRYRWGYSSEATGISDHGVSGEFHRLLRLITPVNSDPACGVSPSGEPCTTPKDSNAGK